MRAPLHRSSLPRHSVRRLPIGKSLTVPYIVLHLEARTSQPGTSSDGRGVAADDDDEPRADLCHRRRHHGPWHRPGGAVLGSPREPGRSRRRPARARPSTTSPNALRVASPRLPPGWVDLLGTTQSVDQAPSLPGTLVVEAVLESLEVKRAVLTEAARALRRRQHPGHEHLLPVGDRDRGRHAVPQPRRRHALLQPRAGHEARRGRHRGADRPRGRRRRSPRSRTDVGQAGRARAIRAGVHRQPGRARLLRRGAAPGGGAGGLPRPRSTR